MLSNSRTLLATTLVVSAVAVAGCGGDSAEDKASAEVCTARDDIAKQVETLKGLTITSATTDQVSDGLQAIQDDLSTIAGARAELSDDRRKEVEEANATFRAAVASTIANVAKSISVEDAATQVEAAFTQLEDSYRDSFAKIDCS